MPSCSARVTRLRASHAVESQPQPERYRRLCRGSMRITQTDCRNTEFVLPFIPRVLYTYTRQSQSGLCHCHTEGTNVFPRVCDLTGDQSVPVTRRASDSAGCPRYYSLYHCIRWWCKYVDDPSVVRYDSEPQRGKRFSFRLSYAGEVQSPAPSMALQPETQVHMPSRKVNRTAYPGIPIQVPRWFRANSIAEDIFQTIMLPNCL